MFKERVYTNRVAVDYQTLYSRAKDYFLRHGIPIDFEFVESDIKNLKYEIRNFGHGQRIILKPYMSNVVPIDMSYDFASFVFNGREFQPPNIPTGYCYCPTTQPFIDILTDPLSPPEVDYLCIIHEHMHALVIKANQKGFNVSDVMDISYNLNDQPENPNSNFGQQWKLLKPYLDTLQAPTSPVVEISRNTDGTETIGYLEAFNNGAKFTCRTLELPDKNNLPNISCIPKGTYQVKWTFSPRFLRMTYEVQNVPKRSGIRIHAANYYYELKGCIALGNSLVDLNGDGHLDTANSRVTLNAFENFMGRRPFTLKIV